MKLSTAKEHRDFFQKNGWIEFDEFISQERLEQSHKALEQVLADRLKASPETLRLMPSEKLFLQGRDVWRSHPILHKLATHVRFAEIASELIGKKPLRLGYDQFLFSPIEGNHVNGSRFFLATPASLEMVSCIKEVECGLICALDDVKRNEDEEVITEGADIFPRKRGNAIYFKPDLMVNWRRLDAHLGQAFYMVVYTSAVSFYILQPQDLHTHSLKRLGYFFNDRLNDKLHPIVFR